jgi:hypothetical protein
MIHFAGNMHPDPDMILASFHHLAALGALALFLAEGALIGALVFAKRNPRAEEMDS